MKLALTVARYELKQRRRSAAWLILMGVCVAVLVATSLLVWFGTDNGEEFGVLLHPTLVYMALLLILVVSPTLSGNAINGDREHQTLAAIQITRATTAEIILGKFLAATVTGLGFVAVTLPFLVLAAILGEVPATTVLSNLGVLLAEVMVVSAVGIGVSGLIARSLFSVATAYLVVAGLTIGTGLFFGLFSLADKVEVKSDYRGVVLNEQGEFAQDADGKYLCEPWISSTYSEPRTDRTWWILAANPFVIIADATPHRWEDGHPKGFFTSVSVGVRELQLPPKTHTAYDECAYMNSSAIEQRNHDEARSAYNREELAGTVPSWWAGLLFQGVLAGALLFGAHRRTHLPAKHMPPGTRIA